MLTAITVFAAEESVRHALLALLVVLSPTSMQLRFQPFAQADANLAESLTLAATVLVPIIGLGQQATSGAASVVRAEGIGDGGAQQAVDVFSYYCYF